MMPEPRTCVSCGEPVEDGHSRVCAACLFAIAAQPDASDYPTITAIDGVHPGEVAVPRLRNGEIFGRYLIERLLGRGGMGEVYAAEQLEHGRRIALKVVNGRLADPADRSRFLREGQLAASVSHPNSVYIFGAEEIEGWPVILMELLAGGTLKDRVEHHGPLPPAEAVDAILQVISGLDAAHQAGVLHRDVKPSNCFVDAEGAVKIGDFGLSISTLGRPGGDTESGVIRGTPQFAAPEQLKGEPLDVRADIYAVGATLHYLLTGRAPFEADTLTALIARVLSDAVPSARACQPSVPAGLDRMLRRCLAKDPADRPRDYAALYRELGTFSSATPDPAPLNLRCTAGVIDQLVLFPLTGAVALGAHRMSLEAQAAGALASVAYFSILEGRWGTSLGKRLCGLRVARTAAAGPVDSGRAMTRAVIYTAASHASAIALLLLDTVGPAGWFDGAQLAGGLLSYLLLAGLFSPARRYNGFATLYDLLTGTRVVARGARTGSRLVDIDLPALPAQVSEVRVLGPYRILEELRTAAAGRVFVASDDSLQRRVWIHADAATPALSVTRRDLARPGRLRWLTGGRTSGAHWHAFEAPDGGPLRNVAAAPQPWSTVKQWLHDLAREIERGTADDTLSGLSIDRVWITRRGVPILLDWDVVESATAACTPDREGAMRLLWHVAAGSLTGHPGSENVPIARPLPLHARDTLRRLEDGGFESVAAMRAAFEDLTNHADMVSRRRRVASMMFPALGLMAVVVVTLITGWFAALGGAADLPHWLDERAALTRPSATDDPRRAEALDLYLAAVYGSDLRGAAFWNSSRGRARRTLRPPIQQMLDSHPVVTSSELGWATEVLQPELERRARRGRFAVNATDFTWMFIVQAVAVAVLTGIGAFATKGGMGLRWSGIALTTGSGDPVSGRRALVRWVVTCLPLIASGALILGLGLPPRQASATVATAVLVTVAGVLYAVLKPERGVQDWIAGTWLVPR